MAGVGLQLAPKPSQAATKTDAQPHPNFEPAFEWTREPLRLDFGSLLGSKIEVKNHLEIRSVKIEKIDSRLDGSSIFEISREATIDEKSMPKGLQDRTSS